MTQLTRLQMTAPASAGSFVKTLQGKTGTGFQAGTHVHKDWWAKTIDYDTALDMAHDAARQREDIMVKVEDLAPTQNDVGHFVFRVGDKEFLPTDHALQQFSIKAEVPSSSVMRELRNLEGADDADHAVMVHLAKNALRRLKSDKVFRLRTYTDGTCRAFLSEKYAPVDNRWYLETLRDFLPSGRLSHWKGSEDTIFGNILLPDSIMDYGQSDDSDYGGMLSIGNCEIGLRTVSQRPSLFRSICMNGCIWGQVNGRRIKRRHVGEINLDQLKMEIAENIELQLPLLDDGIRKFLSLQRMKVTLSVHMKAVVGAVCQNFKVGKTEAVEIWNQYDRFESHEKSLFGVVNAITRAGQTFENPAEWVAFDEFGGALIDTTQDRWESTLRQAQTFREKDLEAIYGSAV